MSQRYLGGIITANPTTPTMTSESGVWTLEQQFQYTTTWSPKIVGNSVRFRSSASAYFSRTPASASNQKTWTWSGWVKRGNLTSNNTFFSAGATTPSNVCLFRFNTSSQFEYYVERSGASASGYTTAVFRDPSAWYHVLIAFDSTQAVEANRLKFYINGVQFSYTVSASITQNADYGVNSASPHNLGRYNYGATDYFDGYMAEVNFVDGQALTPSSFGAYDTTGTWQPLPYTGTYGTNGFYLTFADNSGTTATTLGKDYSGNGNNWTPNNISLTAGTTYDWMLDSPTNWTSGTGNGVANYCVLNPLNIPTTGSPATISNGNLDAVTPSSGYGFTTGTIAASSGKWYWEYVATAGSNFSLGFGLTTCAKTYAGDTGSYMYYSNDGKTYANAGAGVTYGATWTTNDVIGVALDLDAGTATFYKNNVSQGQAFSGLSGTFFPVFSDQSPSASNTFTANFGQRPFSYTPPSGYVALNTLNLPDSNITNGAQYMAATTYTGNASTQTITNGGNNTIGTTFKPDFVWTKSRANAYSPNLYDSVRGINNYLQSNQPSAEATLAGTLTSFNSNGFTLGNQDNSNYTNGSTAVAWQWQAGQGTTSSNTSGSITSTVSVNATAGFSVVTWTGNNGTNATVGHGLGVAPSLIITKNRSGVSDWVVYHSGLSSGYTIFLDTTSAQNNSAAWYGSSAPTSAVFYTSYIGNISINASANNYVSYCWAAVPGYSAFGSYTGNGSTDGPFVYLGFRPRFVLLKVSSTTGDWVVYDTSRNTYNVVDLYLYPNSSAAEGGSGTPRLDILSNGFKLRQSGQDNTSGATYIYAAFAENPFKIARAR
jgi:hypothetical protein